jgi:hypothetical protein
MGSSGSSRGSLIQLFLDLRDDLGSRALIVTLAPSSGANTRRTTPLSMRNTISVRIDNILYCDT